ncbi:MAG: UPF0182 family protein [Candidatus Hodarchaeota archaeon]
MLGFLIFLVYLAFYVPLILVGFAMVKGRKVTTKRWRYNVWLGLGGTAGISLILWCFSIYSEVLWFDNLGYSSVFWKMFSWQWGLFLVFGAVCYITLRLSTMAIKKTAPDISKDHKPNHHRQRGPKSQQVSIFREIVCVFIAILMGLWAKSRWNEILLYLNQVASGISDPIFHKDVSFYLFSLPVFKFVCGWLLILLIIALIGGGGFYFFYSDWTKEKIEEVEEEELSKRERAYYVWIKKDEARKLVMRLSTYGSLIGIGIAAVLIWATVLNIYSLMYSDRGIVFGANYTDVHAQILAYKIFCWFLVVSTIMLLVSAFRRSWKFVVSIVGGGCVLWFLIVLIYPSIVQQFWVKPNELAKETPYIKYNIAFTRRAFNLADLEEKEFKVITEITPETLLRNQATLDNIRLWDWRALKDTYRQIQSIRLYYEFSDVVDIDRYVINGQYRQVMLAVRELDKVRLPVRSRTWINEKFKYTHGYGICLNSVNEFMPGGLPNLLVKDIPPENTAPELKVTWPEVYYGEKTKDHIFVKTEEEEFDYPKGDDNVYSLYQGKGGVVLNSWFRKFIFALRFDGIRILLAKHLLPESRVMFHRQIKERVETIAPFLWYDQERYPVIGSDGKQWWIQDAYAVSDKYPYSEASFWVAKDSKGNFPSLNYIRNSVKVVIDQYNGDVSFYIFDSTDPIIRTYQRVFPALFRPKNEMPSDLQQHVRYPEDFFTIQARMYAIYHMQNSSVFYNREDQWEFANETYLGKRQIVSPYYVTVNLPGEEKEEFILMIPFTPYTPPRKQRERKDNMIGWMAARCDGEHYGKLLVYKFSKKEMIPGPMQIESWIDQNTEMSEKLTLWGQEGSEVIRGNLLVIPIENSLLYVEPLYLQAELGKMPQIKKIILCRGVEGAVIWDDNFSGALKKIAASRVYKPEVPQIKKPEVGVKVTLEDRVRSVVDHFKRYQQLTGEGKHFQAGQELQALGRDLETLLEHVEEKKE